MNGPDFSTHNMIADKEGNVWVVEPGRGVIFSAAHEAPFIMMTNFSLYDYKESRELKGGGADRYKIVTELLDKQSNLDIDMAFTILDAAKQSSGEWITVLSMVYSQNERAVYYCFDMNFNNISKYPF